MARENGGKSMSTHWVFNGCDEVTKARLENYWTRKLPRLQKVLAPYPVEVQDIRLTVYCHQPGPQRFWWEARAVVHLPTGTVVAEANGREPQLVLDEIADTLVRELKRHKERVRRDYVFKRKRRARADLSAAGPMLQRDREVGRQEDFFRLLRPLLRFLRQHAQRELHLLELEGVLHRGELSVGDVLDEVLQRAWQQFADRPKDLPLDLWLTQLLHDVLATWVKQEPRPHVSLETPLPPDKEEAEEEWWADLLGYEDTLTLEDLVPGSQGTEAWDALENEEQRRRLLELLRDFPSEKRQAFLLHVLEDYEPVEIALLQDRTEDQVRADIEEVRQTLRQRLLAAGHMLEEGASSTSVRSTPAETPAS
jgi:RNA polymerase sigma factor (sigma-70 family)